MNNQELLYLFHRHLAQTSLNPIGLIIERAEGVHIYTTDGNAYIDLISGIAVSVLGHRHPAIIEAIKAQLDKHLHVMVYGEFIQEPQVEYASLLCSLLPSPFQKIYFTNSGTEANEAALKLARKVTKRKQFVSFHNSYHGDSIGSLSVTGREIYRKPFCPLLEDVQFLRFNAFEDLSLIDDNVAAVIMEPIQGEGGIIEANKEWLHILRQRCNRCGVLLIFDEIQTGFYRTGSLFAFQHYGIVPDLFTIAKAMGGGMPIGGLVGSEQLLSSFSHDPSFNHVTTFGGHPLSSASALACLKTLQTLPLKQQAFQFERIAKKILRCNGIKQVRGIGAMLGIELATNSLTNEVVCSLIKEKRILVGWTLHHNNIIRIAPPLIMDLELFEQNMVDIKETICNLYNGT